MNAMYVHPMMNEYVKNNIHMDDIPSDIIKVEKINQIDFLRKKRDKLLIETDKYMLIDYPNMDSAKLEEIKTYRQQLRDYMSHQSVVNYDGYHIDRIIDFPTKPSFI